MSQDMPPENEAEFKVMAQNVFNNEGIEGVLTVIIEMMETQLVFARKLREIARGDKHE